MTPNHAQIVDAMFPDLVPKTTQKWLFDRGVWQPGTSGVEYR